jgi:maleylpyruvate isomerase
MTGPEALSVPAQLHDATSRLVRTVDGLADTDWSAPSLLPGWSRGHVVAHLMLNGEALAGVLAGARSSGDVPMYPSQTSRDQDIARHAAADPQVLRDRLMSACQLVDKAVEELPEELHGVRVRRTPDSAATFTAGRVGEMRLREVEIHHADLGLDYSWSDWPATFARLVLESRAKVHQGSPFRAHATDLDETFDFGVGPGPTVAGPAGLLGWWATGRDPGDGLQSDGGVVPWMEAW